MNIYVYPTDLRWFEHLRALLPERVNFWRTDTKRFRALSHGEPLLFKSTTPDTSIHGPGMVMGGAFYDEFLVAPIAEVWEAFGDRNGVATFAELLARFQRMSSAHVDGLTEIGCIMLTMPFFLPRELWVPVHDPNLRHAVKGSHYNLDRDAGARRLWDAVMRSAAGAGALAAPATLGGDVASFEPVVRAPDGHRLGSGYLAYPRLGQGEFRLSVLSAYDGRCGVTGERVRPTLEAAHIKPFAQDGPNVITNGLALRADIHRLFDTGLVTVDPSYRFRVSPIVRSKFQNGREYYQFDGRELAVLPSNKSQWPHREYLEWHNSNVFRDSSEPRQHLAD